jgi:hypothetical protein
MGFSDELPDAYPPEQLLPVTALKSARLRVGQVAPEWHVHPAWWLEHAVEHVYDALAA